MYLNDGWTFLVTLAGNPPLAEYCTCLVDLSSDDDRGDIEVYKEQNGTIHCTLGCACDGALCEIREITEIREYVESAPFNWKFTTFKIVSIVDFVGRFCEAATFDGDTEEEIKMLKEKYGV